MVIKSSKPKPNAPKKPAGSHHAKPSNPNGPITPSEPKRRARNSQAKQLRREHLLETARELWRHSNFSSITMNQVAVQAKLAKGTTYLYFQSKEELLLALLGQELEHWFDHLDGELEQTLTHTPRSLAHLIAESLQDRQNLIRLLAIQGSILEQNVGENAATDFKTQLVKRAARTSILLEHALRLPEHAGLELLKLINALVIGLHQLADLSPIVHGVLQQPNLAPLRVEFYPQLARTLEFFLIGIKTETQP
jgi:TetR/AcrR family transcriptional regulator